MKEYSDKTNISILQNSKEDFAKSYIHENPEPKTKCPTSRNNNQEIYNQAIDKFTPEMQLLKALEEIAELSLALSKNILNPNSKNYFNILEEMADVEIMLEQLKIIFDCHDIIERVKKQKIERLKGLLDD